MAKHRQAQAGNIEGSSVISGATPAAVGVRAAEPGSPVSDLGAMFWGRVGIGRLSTPRAGVRRVPRLLPFQTKPGQKAFVTKHTPQFSTHLCIVAPIAPAPFRSPPLSRGLHRLERLACNQFAAKHRSEHEQDICRQMCYILVSCFVLAPAPSDLLVQDRQGFS